MTTADLTVMMEEAELGAEYLIRVRVVEVREEAIEITSLGDPEPRVASGIRTAKLLPLAVRNTDTSPPA